MIKFYLLGQGLRTDVERRYENYLEDYPGRIHTMLVCSLLDISNLQINDSLLENMNIIEDADHLKHATIRYQEADKVWKTIHPRWDMELLSLLYNDKRINKKHLENAVQSIFKVHNEKITESVIGTLYGLSAVTIEGFKNVPIDIVENVVENNMPDYLSKDTKSSLYATLIGPAHHELKRYNDAINNYDKAIEIDPNRVWAWNNKGNALSRLERYEEAIQCYNRAIEIERSKMSSGDCTAAGRP
jgi:tetratricopeptide (TPR) repeat protein